MNTESPASCRSTPRRISLDQIRIATPCPARWEDMEGDDRRRLCADCGLHVHNVSEMTRNEAEEFLTRAAAEIRAGRRVCVGMYKRADGTIISKNCPVGLAALRRRAWAGVRRLTAAATVCIVGIFVGRRAIAESQNDGRNWQAPMTICRGIRPFSWISEKLGRQRPAPTQSFIAGDMCIPSPPTLPQHIEDLVGLPRDRRAE